MSECHEEPLPSKRVQGHIKEIVRLAEMLAVDYEVGAPPERMLTSVVGIRDFMFRLLGHLEEVMRSPRERRRGNPVGFQVPGEDDDDPGSLARI
jgi:hypothetical protein